MKRINQYLARLERPGRPQQNQADLEKRLKSVLESNAEELIMFFGQGWWRPYNRQTLTAARALARAILAGARGPRIEKKEKADRGWGPNFHYGTRWTVVFDKPPKAETIVVGGGMPTDEMFGRGDDEHSVSIQDGKMIVQAES